MKLTEIVANLLDSQDSSAHSFRRLYNLGAFGMKAEFSLDIKSTLKTVLLDVNPNKSVALPCDYVGFSKIGITNDCGELVTFKKNSQLTNYHQEYFNSNSRLQGVPKLPNYGFIGGVNGYGYNDYLYLNYWYNSTTYNLFGLPSGTVDIGEYKLDEAARIILFQPHFHWDKVLLEYISDGVDEENDDFEVDSRIAEAMKCYLRWQDVIDRPKKASQSTVRDLRLQYYNQKRLAKMRMNPVILNEIQNAERQSWKLVAKA